MICLLQHSDHWRWASHQITEKEKKKRYTMKSSAHHQTVFRETEVGEPVICISLKRPSRPPPRMTIIRVMSLTSSYIQAIGFPGGRQTKGVMEKKKKEKKMMKEVRLKFAASYGRIFRVHLYAHPFFVRSENTISVHIYLYTHNDQCRIFCLCSPWIISHRCTCYTGTLSSPHPSLGVSYDANVG